MQHEGGLLRCRFDFLDRGAQRGSDIGIRGLVETDMAVADLDESDPSAHAEAMAHLAARRLRDRHALEDTARQRPHRSCSDPGHAFQKPATIKVQFVVLLRHRVQLLVTGRDPSRCANGVFIDGRDLGACGFIPDRRRRRWGIATASAESLERRCLTGVSRKSSCRTWMQRSTTRGG
jgi:hypothetical protein